MVHRDQPRIIDPTTLRDSKGVVIAIFEIIWRGPCEGTPFGIGGQGIDVIEVNRRAFAEIDGTVLSDHCG